MCGCLVKLELDTNYDDTPAGTHKSPLVGVQWKAMQDSMNSLSGVHNAIFSISCVKVQRYIIVVHVRVHEDSRMAHLPCDSALMMNAELEGVRSNARPLLPLRSNEMLCGLHFHTTLPLSLDIISTTRRLWSQNIRIRGMETMQVPDRHDHRYCASTSIEFFHSQEDHRSSSNDSSLLWSRW